LLTISKISRQKKNTSRYNIFVQDEYSFSVSEDVLVRYQLYKGMELTRALIEEIKASESWNKAYSDALFYLNFRMRTEKEMRTYLRKKEAAPHIIDKVIEKLRKENFLNDLEFATAFVRDRANRSSKGPKIVANELREKGVKEETIQEALREYSDEKQFQNALRWAEKRSARRSKESHRRTLNKIRAQLLQKGFSHDMATRVMEHVDIPLDQVEEKNKLHVQGDKLYKKYARNYEGYELKQRLQAALYRRGFPSHLINEYITRLDEDG